MNIAKLTKVELAQDLRKALDTNEALRLRIAELEGTVAAQASRIENAVVAYKALRASVPAPKTHRQVGDVVASYTTRDGVVMNKVCVGFNTYAHRPATV